MKPLDLSQFDGATPGEWQRGIISTRIVSIQNRNRVLICSSDDSTVNDGELKSNLALIASAPALVAEVKALREALKSALDGWESEIENEYSGTDSLPGLLNPVRKLRCENLPK